MGGKILAGTFSKKHLAGIFQKIFSGNFKNTHLAGTISKTYLAGTFWREYFEGNIFFFFNLKTLQNAPFLNNKPIGASPVWQFLSQDGLRRCGIFFRALCQIALTIEKFLSWTSRGFWSFKNTHHYAPHLFVTPIVSQVGQELAFNYLPNL